VADIVEAVRTSDEHGGRWDHVSPPTNNGVWGDGSRVPAIVIGQFAKIHFVDHTQHDTLSILNTIEERFGLAPLSMYDFNASSLDSSLR
jgi:phospholipase C